MWGEEEKRCPSPAHSPTWAWWRSVTLQHNRVSQGFKLIPGNDVKQCGIQKKLCPKLPSQGLTI
ncbi:MAG: hypothetical protein DRO11_10115 [Methanobacteriota archaeon]|nr:MAG: hypothetical protein DRO11_10115 [Euryarchaeota archaeon]